MQLFLHSRGKGEGHPAAPGAVQGAEEPQQPGSPQRAAQQGTGREKAQFRGVKACARQQPGVLYVGNSAAVGGGGWDELPRKVGQARCPRELLGRARSLSSVHTHLHLFSFSLNFENMYLKVLIKYKLLLNISCQLS